MEDLPEWAFKSLKGNPKKVTHSLANRRIHQSYITVIGKYIDLVSGEYINTLY